MRRSFDMGRGRSRPLPPPRPCPPTNYDPGPERPVLPFTPRGQLYRVRLTPQAEKSPGGIWYPDNWTDNWTEGEVLAVGPGRFASDTGHRSVMWADPGDRVLFQKHAFREVTRGAKDGVVEDEDLVAVIRRSQGYTDPEPLNDWVMIEQDPEIERASSVIVFAEEDRPRPMSGILEAFGAGQMRQSGPLVGTRRSCAAIWGVSEDRADSLLGTRVYWGPHCEVLAIGRSSLEFLMIQADDILAWDEPDSAIAGGRVDE